jgi:hypothetical protein
MTIAVLDKDGNPQTVRTLADVFGSSALDKGPGTGGSATMRVAIDTASLLDDTVFTDGSQKTQLYDGSNVIGTQSHPVIAEAADRASKIDNTVTITNTTATPVLAAVASTYQDVYGAIVANTSATATSVDFKDNGTLRFTLAVPAGETRGFSFSEGAGYKQAAVNTAWSATAAASVSSLVVSLLAVKRT